MFSQKAIITIYKIVFVLVDVEGRPKPHGVLTKDILERAKNENPMVASAKTLDIIKE